MLSDNDAMATGSTVSPTGTSIASAYGTRTRSAIKPPPSSPASGPMPYIAINGNDAHEPVTPRRQAGQLPQLIWNGTITRSPPFTSADGVAGRHGLGNAFVPDRMPGWHRQLSLGDGNVEVATRHRNGTDDG